jgi:hypothetical protein
MCKLLLILYITCPCEKDSLIIVNLNCILTQTFVIKILRSWIQKPYFSVEDIIGKYITVWLCNVKSYIINILSFITLCPVCHKICNSKYDESSLWKTDMSAKIHVWKLDSKEILFSEVSCQLWFIILIQTLSWTVSIAEGLFDTQCFESWFYSNIQVSSCYYIERHVVANTIFWDITLCSP